MKCPKCQLDNPETSLFCAGCGTKLDAARELSLFKTETLQTPVKELTTGTAFAGRYQIIEELGKGGMGKVYRVLDKKLNEEVALKLIKPEIASDKKTLERFGNELKIARKIVHKNVGRMYHLSEEQGTYYITMEYVPGENLKSSIRRFGPLPIGKTIVLAQQICEGLSEAHRLGIVHRDLKPGNIMIDEEGNARIMDFGIARSLKERGITGEGVIIGTPEYMSPEQVEAKDIDHRTDIYSLGVILYEMVTGRVPFEGDTPFAIGVKHKSELPKDPRQLNTQIPEDLSRLILRCLEKDREKRYPDAAELLADLGRIGQGFPTAEKEAPRSKAFTSREITVKFNVRKILLPAILVSAIIVAAIFLFVIQKPGPALNPKLVLVNAFVNRTGDASLDALGLIAADEIAHALSQTGIAEVVPTMSVLETSRIFEAGRHDDLRAWARETGAGIVVSGTYDLIDSELQFRASITDVTHRKPTLIQSVELRKGNVDNKMGLVEELRRRIMGALAQHFIVGAGVIEADQKFRRPPVYEAYQEYLQGLDVFGVDYEESVRHFNRAVELDPTFVEAKLYISVAYGNQGRYEEADALLQSIVVARDELSPYENRWLDWYTAELRGQYDKALRLLRETEKLAPNLYTIKYLVGLDAISINRPQETVDVYAWMDSQDPKIYFTRPATAWWFDVLARAHHMLGKYKKEIELAKRGSDYFPKDLRFARIEVRALAALGKIGEVRKVVEGCLNVDATSGTPGGVMREAALELHAHGHKDASREFAVMAIEWAEGRPKAERKTEGRQEFYADLLYFAGRFDEAGKIYGSLASEHPENIDIQGSLGTLAARKGDREGAMKVFEELGKLDRPFLLGNHLYWQACIASLLGEKDRAVALLKEAFSQGCRYGVTLHRDIDLEPLWDYPPFKELLRPKG
jgi:serine/threonine-protein kinase